MIAEKKLSYKNKLPGKSKKIEIYVKNMLTGNGKNAILSELLGTNCFYETDKEIMFQKK